MHLADGNSFEIFSAIERDFPVIFTTAYDKYAVEAFRLNSVDYLLKPIKKQELNESLDKYINRNLSKASISYDRLLDLLSKEENSYQSRFTVKYGQNLQSINVEDIAYFYTENRIVYLILFNKDKFSIDLFLDDIESKVDEKQFFRVNRQFIVNIESIEKMSVLSKSRLKLYLKPEFSKDVIVSVERSPIFKKWLNR